MNKVNAPEGFEGCYFFEDATKEYVVAIRRKGSNWWKNVGYAGHRHNTVESTIMRAEREVIRAVANVQLGFIDLS